MENSIKTIHDTMDLEKTKSLFENSIGRAEALKTEVYNEADIKKQKVVLGYGNLHLNTARVKMNAVKLLGYKDSLGSMKNAIERKVRNARKYGK